MKRLLSAMAIGAMLAGGLTGYAFAGGVHNESGDAGDLPGTAQLAIGAGNLATIIGSYDGDIDMYGIIINDPDGWSAEVVASTSDTDLQLYLFAPDGTGIWFDDDAGVGLWPRLSGNPGGAGLYYLAVTSFDTDALNPDDDECPRVQPRRAAPARPEQGRNSHR